MCNVKLLDLRKHVDNFISLKRATGLKYKTEQVMLTQFIHFCKGKYTEENLPADAAVHWIMADPNLRPKSLENKTGVAAEFSKYLLSLGLGLIKIPQRNKRQNKYAFVPHIYTESEMDLIWNVVDHLKPSSVTPNLHRCIPALFRLLHGTGLRISEALGLDVEDVDFRNNMITVRHAKYDKERFAPMSDSLSHVLKEYANNCLLAPAPKEPFFYYRRGVRLKGNQIYGHFRKVVLKYSGIPYKGGGNGPRIHDLRHTFAVNAMDKMVDEGKDLYVALPILSAYLGHESVASTERYVRLTVQRHSKVTDSFSEIITNWPEVLPYEEI